MELQWVVGAQRDPQSSRKVIRQRVAMVTKEQGVVTERGHGYEDLRQVVNVLQRWHLKQPAEGKCFLLQQYLSHTSILT